MSQEKVEIVGRLIAAINDRELSDELAGELLAPDFSFQATATATSNHTFHGVEGVRAWITDLFEPLDGDTTLTIERTIAEGEDFVFAISAFPGTALDRAYRCSCDGRPSRGSRAGRSQGRRATPIAAKHSKPWGWRSRRRSGAGVRHETEIQRRGLVPAYGRRVELDNTHDQAITVPDLLPEPLRESWRP